MSKRFSLYGQCTVLACGLLMASLLFSCYPKRVGSPGPDGKKLTWAEMNRQQRQMHMKTNVLPRAAIIFKSWRPERFANVECSLCHGWRSQTGDFKMPTDHLPRLSGDVFLGPEFQKHPKTTRLKLNRLVPEIASALGVKKFSIITKKGFGCYSCHLGPDGRLFGNKGEIEIDMGSIRTSDQKALCWCSGNPIHKEGRAIASPAL